MTKDQVRQQFGANAAAYVSSPTHAQGASLARLVELVAPRPEWRVLDVATATGHTALAFAPHVAVVLGLDLTAQMLPLAAGLAAERGAGNVVLAVGDVDDLPLAEGAFDLVTCRIAAHHFPDVGRFLAEAARVLAPGGLLAVVDNVVPGSRLRGKRADLQREAGEYVNAFEQLRDPSHVRCLSLEEWAEALLAAGLSVVAQETLDKRLTFETWAARHTPEMQTRLRAMLLQAPEAARAFLDPRAEGLTTFRLREGLFVARRRNPICLEEVRAIPATSSHPVAGCGEETPAAATPISTPGRKELNARTPRREDLNARTPRRYAFFPLRPGVFALTLLTRNQ